MGERWSRGEVWRLAEAMCVSSHHGLTRTEWPCPYHIERAENTVSELTAMQRRVASRPDGEQGG